MENTSLVVLVGGKSSRVKSNKAFLPPNNTPLSATIIHQLQDLFQEVVVVTNDISPIPT